MYVHLSLWLNNVSAEVTFILPTSDQNLFLLKQFTIKSELINSLHLLWTDGNLCFSRQSRISKLVTYFSNYSWFYSTLIKQQSF